jgi:glutamate racemase
MKKEGPIGVFDSGIGGLSVLKQFMRFIPYESYVYLGDTARVPYGNKTPETVIEYSIQSASFLIEKGAKLIVIACNTASSVALEEVRKNVSVPVIGMINPGATAALRTTSNGNIGVIGTRATISSQSYDKELKALSSEKKINIFSQACPLFVPIVEEGWLRHQASKIIAEEYLNDLKSHSIDTLILGCTHYPLLAQLISEILPNVALIDSGEHAAVSAIRVLGEAGLLAQERDEYSFRRQVEFYVTDIPSTFHEIAERFLGFDVDSPVRVVL